MPTKPFVTRFQASDANTRTALADILGKLTPQLADPADAGTLEVVLAEVLNNVVEHAYADNPNGIIQASFTIQPELLTVQIIDQGHPMPNGVLPEGKLASLNVDFTDLPEGGFGWFMIKELTQDLTYARKGSENHLSFGIVLNSA